jgi:hypothetical protein
MMNFRFKICKRCGKKFILTGKNQKYCKECGIVMHKQWYKANPKRVQKYNKQYYLEHSECMKQWREDYPERAREIERKHFNKRNRNLSYIPLNEWKEGNEFHHINKIYGIYMPKEEHTSISHNVFTGKGMDEMNALAFNYLP